MKPHGLVNIRLLKKKTIIKRCQPSGFVVKFRMKGLGKGLPTMNSYQIR